MPKMTAVKSNVAEPSKLMPGLHPAFLLAVTYDATPADWIMAKNNPMMFTWHFAIYSAATGVGHEIPEYIPAYSTPKCSFGGKRATKCYEWTTTLIERSLAVNEEIDIDPLMPIPCNVAISRKNSKGEDSDFATVEKLYVWPEGKAYLQNGPFMGILANFWDMKKPDDAPPFPGMPAQGASAPAGPTAQPVAAPPAPPQAAQQVAAAAAMAPPAAASNPLF